MGLLSFIKGKGRSIFGKKKKEEIEQEEKVTKTEEQLLKEEVTRLGLPVDNLYVELGKAVSITGFVKDTATAERVALTVGNVEGIIAVDNRLTIENPTPEAKFYTVESGDSLSKIAKQFYGDAQQYNKIFEANQPMIKDVNEIYPGQKLRIPA